MSDTLTIEMVTPEKTALEEPADAVVLPAFEGEMGVLLNHEPYMVQLKAGMVRVTRGGETQSLAISGGFAEIRDNRVSIFAETAEMAGEIDDERARQAFERAKAQTRVRGGDPLTLAQAEGALRRAQVRLRVAHTRKRPRKRPPA